MAMNKLRLPEGGGITISGDAADKLIAGADGRAALLYIYILRNSEDFSISAAASALKMTEGETEAALMSLNSAGLVQWSRVPQVEFPEPKLADPEFKMLLGDTQRRLGKTLSPSEMTILKRIYTDIMLPPEVISILVSHCVDREKVRTSGNRLPTMKQIEAEGYIWSEKGINTLDAATEYLCRCSAAREKSSEVKKLLGISAQTLKDTEQDYIENWLGMGFGLDEIGEAYDRTVLNTGKLHWNYMNKILLSWHEKGLHTMKDIIEKDKPAKGGRSAAAKPAATGATGAAGEHEKAAVQRLQMLKKTRGE
ncbi:MAG: DnaD domain protein [Ruminococcaceae bacterium]|nr:DnaD domain protein [Oscillospiraceae bacterium]